MLLGREHTSGYLTIAHKYSKDSRFDETFRKSFFESVPVHSESRLGRTIAHATHGLSSLSLANNSLIPSNSEDVLPKVALRCQLAGQLPSMLLGKTTSHARHGSVKHFD